VGQDDEHIKRTALDSVATLRRSAAGLPDRGRRKAESGAQYCAHRRLRLAPHRCAKLMSAVAARLRAALHTRPDVQTLLHSVAAIEKRITKPGKNDVPFSTRRSVDPLEIRTIVQAVQRLSNVARSQSADPLAGVLQPAILLLSLCYRN
jgi:hypothetical protein